MQPPSKRSLRPTASQPTTAERYGEQHGIPDHIQAALQNVGRKGRMAVSQGRSFDRTQSFPVTSHSNPFDTFDIPPPVGFMTNQETFQHAQRIIQKDVARQNELKPYALTSDSVPQPRSSPPMQSRSLSFNGEGIDDINPEVPAQRRPAQSERPGMAVSKKRKDEGSDTEVDDEAEVVPELTFAESSTSINDFPPVFSSTQITQPDLFAPAARNLPSRLLKGMPGRNLGKTVSAPVGRMGAWDGEAMETEEDGFDVSEWAANEEF